MWMIRICNCWLWVGKIDHPNFILVSLLTIYFSIANFLADNTMISRGRAPVPKRVSQQTGPDTVKVGYCQNIDNVTQASGTGVTITGFPLFVNQSADFPWLSRYADMYNKYRVLRCSFMYVPACSSLKDGSIHLAHSLDPDEQLPITVQAMSSMQAYKSNAIWKHT